MVLGRRKKRADALSKMTGPPPPLQIIHPPNAPASKRARERSRSPLSRVFPSPSSIRTRSEERLPLDPPPLTPTPMMSLTPTPIPTPTPSMNSTLLPLFLGQSRTEIQEKFQELEWLQRERLHQGSGTEEIGVRWHRESDDEVKLRNRYLNVQPWKHHRIHLQVPADRCDYINASPVMLADSRTKAERRFIATQGPKMEHFNHFWRMIWHETGATAVIVMLTQTMEAGREKCAQYFPEHLDEPTLAVPDRDEFGDGFAPSVTLLEVTHDEASRSCARKLQLVVGEESKIVWHLLFTGWPDFGVPEGSDREALLELIKLSNEKNVERTNPRVVHCSAGVGRSGTFIALDHLLAELEQGVFDELPFHSDDDAVFDTVNSLREQRMTMVQGDGQLHFIYQMLRLKWVERQERKGDVGLAMSLDSRHASPSPSTSNLVPPRPDLPVPLVEVPPTRPPTGTSDA
ncbi:MAG: hypothetical protein M1838_004407 [Thelocarpon superellum]|nr:MAG: hypothetical protein M1838_004407 [Thelocarpon superellum]